MDTSTTVQLPPPPSAQLPPPPSAPPAPPPPAGLPPVAGPPSGRTERPNGRRLPLIVTAVVAALIGGATGGTVAAITSDEPASSDTASVADSGPDTAQSTSQDASTPAAGEGLSVSQIAEQVGPSVAAVEVGSRTGQGQGSAVIIDADGHLVTNNHVVEGAGSITVQLADGSRLDATLVGTDPVTDLAVLRVDADGLPAATLSTTTPDIGDPAVAIGSPFGLDGSVSAGVVSALDRSLPAGGASLTGLLQTDAAINPGNSGGALVDDRGEVIGINTAIISRSGTSGGVGFAVPSTVAADVADQLIRTGEVQRAVLGVSGRDIDQQVAEAYGIDADAGPLVLAVEPGSGAADAGLQAGDIITSVDGERVRSMGELAATVRELTPGDTVEVGGIRDGESFTFQVRLGQA